VETTDKFRIHMFEEGTNEVSTYQCSGSGYDPIPGREENDPQKRLK
jgi:hypothetical protein